ncbi:MAG: PEP-CTERM sorting domain-containing protein [Pseudomonadota bacterium]
MNTTLLKFVSALALATCSLCATAAPISVTDTMTLNLPVTNTAQNSFTINLLDNGTAYVAGVGSVVNATLHLTLSDPLGGNERYSIFFGSNPNAVLSSNNITSTAMFDIVLDAAALADLSFDGQLQVILRSALQGRDDDTANYLAVSSRLDANQAGGGAAAIPEPASFGLMAIALAGLAAVRRRKQK